MLIMLKDDYQKVVSRLYKNEETPVPVGVGGTPVNREEISLNVRFLCYGRMYFKQAKETIEKSNIVTAK